MWKLEVFVFVNARSSHAKVFYKNVVILKHFTEFFLGKHLLWSPVVVKLQTGGL